MAVTLEEVAGFLKSTGYKFERIEEKNLITFGISKDDETAAIAIKALENGGLFKLIMNPLNIKDKEALKITTDNQYIGLVLQQMLYVNYITKFGTWEYDTKDGEVRFTIEIPLEDASMTQKQFDRVLSGAFTALEYQKKIKNILVTGEMPEEQDETIAQLEALLTALKGEAESSEDEI